MGPSPSFVFAPKATFGAKISAWNQLPRPRAEAVTFGAFCPVFAPKTHVGAKTWLSHCQTKIGAVCSSSMGLGTRKTRFGAIFGVDKTVGRVYMLIWPNFVPFEALFGALWVLFRRAVMNILHFYTEFWGETPRRTRFRDFFAENTGDFATIGAMGQNAVLGQTRSPSAHDDIGI